MKKQIIITSMLLSALAVSVYGQKQVDKAFNSWWTYAGNHKLSEKWGIHTLYSWRRNDFVKYWQQSLLRVGVSYKVKDNLTASIGYDWVITYPYGKQPIAHETTEQRIYEQLLLKNKVGKIGIKHRYRLEHRFIENTPVKNRIRYRMVASLPLGKNKIEEHTFFISVFDEIFINLGNDIKGQILNQNWIYTALGYKTNKGITYKLGYMNQFLIKSDNIHIESNNTLQVGIAYNFDFSAGKER